jgi:hypothetical protein
VAVTATRPSRPPEDLAWCEWIVRMHHPGQAGLLGVFFGAYGGVIPSWHDRQALMLARCQSLLDVCHQEEPGGPGERQWAHRLAVTSAWHAIRSAADASGGSRAAPGR